MPIRPFECDLPEFGNDKDVVTPASLHALHKELGFVPGKVPKSRRAAAKKSDKERKSFDEIAVMRRVRRIFDKYAKDHPPFGLPKVLRNEKLGSMAVDGNRGITDTGFLSAEETARLPGAMQNWKSEPIVHMIGKVTQRKIAMAATQAFLEYAETLTGEQRENLEQATVGTNLTTGLPTNPLENVITAAGNSNRFMWSVLEVIPHVYRLEFGCDPTPQEAEEIAKNSTELVEMFASCHLDVFRALDGRLRRDPRGNLSLLFDHRWFCLRRKGGKLMLAVDAGALSQLIIQETGLPIRMMCAALLAKHRGKNLIEHVYGKDVEIARVMLYDNVCDKQ